MSRGGAPLERGDSYEDQLRGLFLDCCPDHSGGSMSSSGDLERICRSAPSLKGCEISRVTWLFFRRLELNSEQTEDLVTRLSSESQLITFDDFKTGLVELIERMNNAADDAGNYDCGELFFR